MAAFGTLTPQEQAEVPPSWIDRLVKYALPFDWQGVTMNRTPDTPEYKPGMPLSGMLTPEAIQQGIDAGMAVSGGGLATRAAKPPPVVGVLHATGAPTEFVRPKLPPKEHDFGIHATVDPTATDIYTKTKLKPGEIDFNTGRIYDPNWENTAYPRTKPFLGDFRASLMYPTDAVKWNVPGNVISGLENAMDRGFVAPRGLLSDMYNISSDVQWKDQFIPMLKDRGYDSIFYPHFAEGSNNKYNTFMGFEPEQFTPRFSPEGLKLAQERGVKEPMTRERGFNAYNEPVTPKWTVPTGVIKRPAEFESLVRDPAKNTTRWWEPEAGPSLIKTVSDELEAVKASQKENFKNLMYDKISAQKQAEGYDKLAKGEITPAEYFSLFDKPKSPMFGKPESLVTKKAKDESKYVAFMNDLSPHHQKYAAGELTDDQFYKIKKKLEKKHGY